VKNLTIPSPWEVAADLLAPPEDDFLYLPHQIPPDGNWFVWMLLGGRGSGKTAAAAKYMHEHLKGPPCLPHVPGGHWCGIIAPTLGDGVTSCVNGPSGLRAHQPDLKLRQTAGGTIVRYPNGAETKVFGAHTPEDVERLRSGGNRCFVWAEELAAWRYLEDCWQHMRYGLRVGPRPHVVVSTTPKPRRLIKDLIKDPEVAVTHATTAQNPHLDDRVKRDLYADYEGTRLGRQELAGQLLEDIEGALWKPEWIEDNRIPIVAMPEEMDQIIVGVDPAASKAGDETGIVVVGLLSPGNWHAAEREGWDAAHAFVLADYSMNGSTADWAKTVIRAYYDWEANYVVAEINNGGEMVAHSIQVYDPSIMIKVAHASRGKDKRAEPIANQYEKGRVHHVGMFTELEEQMTSWDKNDPDESWSPDRMDALVWAIHTLMVSKSRINQSQAADYRLADRR
jgi:phage terminase large subunit-like protein